MLENNNYFINDILKKYLIPTIIVLLEVSSIAFYNTLIVGKMLGKDALAVMSLTSSFSFLYYMFGCLINIGAAIAASVALGQNDLKKVGKYERFAFISSVVIPVLISVLLLIFMEPVMTLLGADSALYEFSKVYVQITLALGFVYCLMYFPFNFLRVDGRSKTATGVFALMAVLDYVSVYVVLKAGVGLTGVGFASMISALIADVVGILFLCFGKNRQITMERVSLNEILPMAKEVFELGSSSGLNNFWNMLRTMMLNKMVVGAFGTDGLAMFAVACSVINLTNATTLGIGQTTAPLIGVFYGERDNKSIQTLMKSGTKYSIAIHTVLFILLFMFASAVAGAFGITEDLNQDCVRLIRWTALGLISSGVVNLYISAYASLKRVVISNFLTFFRAFGFVTLITSLLVKGPFGDYYITSFMWADLWTIGLMFLLSYFVQKRDKNIYGILMLDRRMDEGSFLAFSVSADKNSGAMAAERISAFCDENDLSPKLTMGIPLAVEEIISVMSEHCLGNDSSKYSDVRIFKNDDDVLVRVRCGGAVFDPMEWYLEKKEKLSPEELLEDPSLGIKLLNDYAKDITFSRTFGVNNLVAVL